MSKLKKCVAKIMIKIKRTTEKHRQRNDSLGKKGYFWQEIFKYFRKQNEHLPLLGTTTRTLELELEGLNVPCHFLGEHNPVGFQNPLMIDGTLQTKTSRISQISP